VSGHGIGAALLMAETREAIRALALTGADPRENLMRADKLLRDDFGDEQYITLLFSLLDPVAGTLSYVSAGHPSGYVIDTDGQIKYTLTAQCPALCLPTSRPCVAPLEQLQLQTGDIAVLLTDGVLEAAAAGGEEFGPDRVLEIVRAHREKPSAEIVRILF